MEARVAFGENYKGVYYCDPETTDRVNRSYEDIAWTLREFEEMENVHLLFDTFLSYVPSDRFLYVSLTKLSPRHKPIATGVPKGWGEEYIANAYSEFDPILALTVRRSSWFSWNYARSGLHGKAKKVMEAAAAHGLKDGISIPYHGPFNYHAVISLAGEKNADDMDAGERTRLSAVARGIHARVAELEEKGKERLAAPARLTDREVECLRWVQLGKTDGEIAEILNLERYTVAEYVQSAMKKLGSATRANAVAIGVASGLLNLAL